MDQERSVPNQIGQIRSSSSVGSDLYRRFRDHFEILSAQEFGQDDFYKTSQYLSVDKDTEGRLSNFFDHARSGVVFLLGQRGVGKTHLVHYLLGKRYAQESIVVRKPGLYNNQDGDLELIYYITNKEDEREIKQDPLKDLQSKIAAMNEFIESSFNLHVTDEELREYIRDNIPSRLFFYDDEEYHFDYEKLEMLISRLDGISSIIFICDDMESFSTEEQNSIISGLLRLYETIKPRKPFGTRVKVLFITRLSTHHNLRSRAFDTTTKIDQHRLDYPLVIKVSPELKSIFELRFNEITNQLDYYRRIGNPTSWFEAREVLWEVLESKDFDLSKTLLGMNNESVPEALRDLVTILSNRRYTQRNATVKAAFKLRKYDYYLDNLSIWRVLFLGEKAVYVNNEPDGSLPSPFYKGGDIEYDMLTYYLMNYMDRRYIRSMPNNGHNGLICKKEEMANLLIEVSKSSADINITNGKVKNALECLVGGRYIRKNDRLRHEYTVAEELDNDEYYMRSRGHLLFQEMIRDFVVFQILRDSFSFDISRFDCRCSIELTHAELSQEYLKYIEDLAKCEILFISQIIHRKEAIREYVESFGQTFIFERLAEALKQALRRYYVSYYQEGYESKYPDEDDILKQLDKGIDDLKKKAYTLKSTSAIKNLFGIS